MSLEADAAFNAARFPREAGAFSLRRAVFLTEHKAGQAERRLGSDAAKLRLRPMIVSD